MATFGCFMLQSRFSKKIKQKCDALFFELNCLFVCFNDDVIADVDGVAAAAVVA